MLRYVVEVRFVVLIIFVSPRCRPSARQSTSSLPLDRHLSMRRRPLDLVLDVVGYSPDLSVDPCVCAFERDAPVLFGVGITVRVDMDVHGVARCFVQHGGWFVGLTRASTIVVDFADTSRVPSRIRRVGRFGRCHLHVPGFVVATVRTIAAMLHLALGFVRYVVVAP